MKLLPTIPLRNESKRINFVPTESSLPNLINIQKYIRSYNAQQFCVDYHASFAKRRNILHEIIESEKSYISGLDNLYRIFLLPLRETAILNPDGAFLSSDEVGKIFGQIDVIMNLNKDFLKQMLEIKENFNMHSVIGPLFDKYIPKLKIYTIYVNSYDESMETLIEAKKRKPFRKFLEDALKTPKIKLASIEDYLITPVQRIPRYTMLFLELKKSTLKEHPDFEYITKAHSMFLDISSTINEKKRESEAIVRLIALQNSIIFPDESQRIKIVSNNRKIIFESLVTNALFEFNQIPKCHLFLFDDIFLITKYKKKTYTYIKDFPVGAIKRYLLGELETNFILCLDILSDPNTNMLTDFILEVDNNVLRSHWVNAFESIGVVQAQDNSSRLSMRKEKKKLFGIF